jgi:dephospho-CoA kinase
MSGAGTMKRWVVTGPIAAGKSRVSQEIARQTGAPIISGDALGHEVLAATEVQDSIVRRFGPEMVKDGQVDRPALGRVVFADPAAMQALNQLTHPRISALAEERFRDLEKGAEHALAVLEAAVYFLFPSPPRADLVLTVTAPADLRARRLARDRGLTPEAARERIEAQAHLEPLWARADLILENDGPADRIRLTIEQLVQKELE